MIVPGNAILFIVVPPYKITRKINQVKHYLLNKAFILFLTMPLKLTNLTSS